MVSGVRQSIGLQPADIEFDHLIEVISAEKSMSVSAFGREAFERRSPGSTSTTGSRASLSNNGLSV